MKTKLSLVALTVCLLTAGSLAASEAVWEVIIPTDLRPSTAALPDPMPVPVYIEYLIAEVPPAPVVSAPLRLPIYRPAPRPGKAFFDANLVLMVGLNIADYLSTKEALKYPGLTETNPIMKPFVKSPAAFVAIKLGTTALSYWSMKSLFKKNRTMAWIMTTASNAILSYVVANNYRLIQGARAR